MGCGWCFGGTGGGVCVASENACPRGSAGFTWDPPGCFANVSVDASADGRALASPLADNDAATSLGEQDGGSDGASSSGDASSSDAAVADANVD